MLKEVSLFRVTGIGYSPRSSAISSHSQDVKPSTIRIKPLDSTKCSTRFVITANSSTRGVTDTFTSRSGVGNPQAAMSILPVTTRVRTGG